MEMKKRPCKLLPLSSDNHAPVDVTALTLLQQAGQQTMTINTVQHVGGWKKALLNSLDWLASLESGAQPLLSNLRT